MDDFSDFTSKVELHEGHVVSSGHKDTTLLEGADHAEVLHRLGMEFVWTPKNISSSFQLGCQQQSENCDKTANTNYWQDIQNDITLTTLKHFNQCTNIAQTMMICYI